jgi:hypothetical protein
MGWTAIRTDLLFRNIVFDDRWRGGTWEKFIVCELRKFMIIPYREIARKDKHDLKTNFPRESPFFSDVIDLAEYRGYLRGDCDTI